VNAAVKAACGAVHKTPPAPPTAWRLRLSARLWQCWQRVRWRVVWTDLFPKLARCRGLLIGVSLRRLHATIGGRGSKPAPALTITGHRPACHPPSGNHCRQTPHPALEPRRALCRFCDGDCGMLVHGEPESARAYPSMASTVIHSPDRRVVIGWFASRRGFPAARRLAWHLPGLRPFQCFGTASNGS